MRKLIVVALSLIAQTVGAAKWQCDLPGGSYVVETGHIASVSTHEYVVDAAARVTELTVATTSSVTARFYYIEPAVNLPARGQAVLERIEEQATDIAARAGQEPVWKKVIKTYPTTTHAHTVEYRLDTKEQVQKLFDSVMSAWKQNKDVTIRITSPS